MQAGGRKAGVEHNKDGPTVELAAARLMLQALSLAAWLDMSSAQALRCFGCSIRSASETAHFATPRSWASNHQRSTIISKNPSPRSG
jgi:hypothetical protein